MNAKTICALACLTGSLIPPGALAQTTTEGGITRGTITVPGKDLIFKGPLTGPLDPYGGFQIEVKLPQKDISAAQCAQDDGLAIQMGDTSIPYPDSPTHIDPALAKKKQAYYAELVKLSQKDQEISIGIQGKREYLTYKNGKLYAPYCIVAFSGFDK